MHGLRFEVQTLSEGLQCRVQEVEHLEIHELRVQEFRGSGLGGQDNAAVPLKWIGRKQVA